MQPPSSLLLRLEIIWWAITAVVLLGILLPFRGYWQFFPFLWTNVIFILTFITITRYIFLLPYTLLSNLQRLKVAIAFLCIPAVFLLIQELNRFQVYLDYNGIDSMLKLPAEQSLIDYVYNEMLLFGVGSIASGIIFPIRLVISIWRKRNRGTA